MKSGFSLINQKMQIQVFHSSSTGNLYRVDDLIIDPGVPIKEIKKALDFKLSSIKGCLCSHFNMDHAKGARDIMAAGVDLYCHKETALTLGLSGHRLHTIESMKQFKIGDWTVKAFDLVHDVPCLGFIMAKGEEKVLYASDTNYIPYRFRGLTYILLGVNYDTKILANNITRGYLHPEAGKRILRHHMSLDTAKGFFKANDMGKVNEIYLLHLSDGNSDAEHFRNEIQGITGIPVYV